MQQLLGTTATWSLDPTGYGFHLMRGMLLPIPMYRPVAPVFLIDRIFFKCEGNCDTWKCFQAHLACNKNCGHCEGRICNNKKSQRDDPFDKEQEDLRAV